MYQLIQQQQNSNFPWKEIATIIFSALTALIAVYNWQASRRRTKLKDDLDILRRYREEFDENVSVTSSVANDDRYIALQEKIQKRMYRAYVLRKTDKSDVLSGIAIMALAFIAWLLPVALPLILRVVMVVVFVSVGIFFIFIGIKDRNLPRDFSTQMRDENKNSNNKKDSG